jgi:hypothetical protein
MKKYFIFGVLATLAAGIVLKGPQIVEAAGHISYSNLSAAERTRTLDVSCPAVASLAETAVTEGTAGVIDVLTVNGVTVATSTAPLMRLPYAAKLKLKMVDSDNDNANVLRCSAIVLRGRNQFGTLITETVALPNETEVKTTKVYEQLFSYSASGCANGADAEDAIRIRVSNEVGLPARVSTEDAIISACIVDGTVTLCHVAADFDTDLDVESIDFDGVGVTLAAGDRMTLRVRGPGGE